MSLNSLIPRLTDRGAGVERHFVHPAPLSGQQPKNLHANGEEEGEIDMHSSSSAHSILTKMDLVV